MFLDSEERTRDSRMLQRCRPNDFLRLSFLEIMYNVVGVEQEEALYKFNTKISPKVFCLAVQRRMKEQF